MWILDSDSNNENDENTQMRRSRRVKTNSRLSNDNSEEDDDDADNFEDTKNKNTTLSQLRLWPGRLQSLLSEQTWPEILRSVLLERCGLATSDSSSSSLGEMIACEILLSELMSRPQVESFLNPIDLRVYTDYTLLVPSPICLSDIRRKLELSMSRLKTGNSALGVPVLANSKSCPNGHALTTYTCTDHVSCDLCERNILIGKTSRGCAWCNFDVCEMCSDKDTTISSSSQIKEVIPIPYRNADDFRKDVMRVWSNCYRYNHMDSVAAIAATELEEWFEKAFDGLVRNINVTTRKKHTHTHTFYAHISMLKHTKYTHE